MSIDSQRKQFRGRLTLDFPTPVHGLQRLNGFIAVALSGVSGISEMDIILEKTDSKQDSKKTMVIFRIEAASDVEGWDRVSKVRKAVSDPLSKLNTVGHMKKVFNGSMLHIFEPSTETSIKSKIPVRYREDAPNDPFLDPNPPLAFVRTKPVKVEKDVSSHRSPKHRLPPDSVHIPFDIVVIPPGLRSPPESPKREMHYHLPGPTRTEPKQVDPIEHLTIIDMRPLMMILTSPKPMIPDSLLALN